jgi:hypothetical protein
LQDEAGGGSGEGGEGEGAGGEVVDEAVLDGAAVEQGQDVKGGYKVEGVDFDEACQFGAQGCEAA